ncbi:MAG: HisA/HisF-related TIM barrel protein, partial [Spirochaetaceae bacterium]|nr:HisA/HisF-related TIM barrel protein [Spirochaetaceae bacterium]
GADRVAVNSAACRDPAMIDRLAARFGVQCVVLAIDARLRGRSRAIDARSRDRAWTAHGAVAATAAHGVVGWEVVIEAGRRDTGREAAAWAREGASRGAGEILLTSIDRDGTGSGYDSELVAAVAAASGLPVVASGGASEKEHFLEGARAGARALLAAGVFHRGELSIADVKRYLAEKGLEVRI